MDLQDLPHTVGCVDKIGWDIPLQKTWEETFYPSLVKNLKKDQALFEEHVEIRLEQATLPLFEEVFWPLYMECIASKPYYTLNSEKIFTDFCTNIEQERYFFLQAYFQGAFIGGTLFKEDGALLRTGLRVYKKGIRKEIGTKTSIDMYMEKVLYVYAYEKKEITTLLHGRDVHPFAGRGRIGLPLFKLQVGGRPRLSRRGYETLQLPVEELTSIYGNTFIMFHDASEETQFLQKAVISLDTNELDESLRTQVIKTLTWANIPYTLLES